MEIYYLILLLILISALLFGNDRKKIIFFVVIILTVISGLRSSDIGIDLQLHYARNYEAIVSTDWNNLVNYVGGTKYDLGFVLICKVLGLISTDKQWFIFATSLFFYCSYGRYLYRYSDSVFTDVFMFYTSFIYFMFMNIVAQSIAIGILLLGVDYLVQKKYMKYAAVVLIAAFVHNSALVCMIFILLDILPTKRKYVFGYILSLIVVLLSMDRLIPALINTFFSQYAWYLEGNIHGEGVSISTFGLAGTMIYFLCICVSFLFIYLPNKEMQVSNRVIESKKNQYEVKQLSTNFLLYMAITALICRVLLFQIELAGRVGYYFNLYAFSLLGRANKNISDRNNKIIVYGMTGLFMILFFLLFGSSAGKMSYGVVPYKFFWE